MPLHANPTDHALDLINTDFYKDPAEGHQHIDDLAARWVEYSKASLMGDGDQDPEADSSSALSVYMKQRRLASSGAWRAPHQTVILIERNVLNYSRNLLAYGVRLAMYSECSFLCGVDANLMSHCSRHGHTVGDGVGQSCANLVQNREWPLPPWVRDVLNATAFQNDRLSVHFFSVAFLGFMSVAGIPAFLEERQVFLRERLNGLYGPGAYVIANSLCTLPYLFVCALLFAVIRYACGAFARTFSESDLQCLA